MLFLGLAFHGCDIGVNAAALCSAARAVGSGRARPLQPNGLCGRASVQSVSQRNTCPQSSRSITQHSTALLCRAHTHALRLPRKSEFGARNDITCETEMSAVVQCCQNKQKTEQVAKKRRNAQLSLSVHKPGCHIQSQTQGC